jgi:hypothetical protein
MKISLHKPVFYCLFHCCYALPKLRPVFDEIQLRKLVTLVKAAGYPAVQPAEDPNDTIPTSV